MSQAPQTSQAPHPALIHKSPWPQGTTRSSCLLPTSDNDNACPRGYASTTGDTQEVPRTCQALHTLHLPQDYVCLCLQPPADLTTSKAGSVPHTGSPASTQAAGAPFCAIGLACHRVHTCMWLWETTCPFCSLIMSRNNNAHSLEHATTTGDTQEVPRACQVLHKLHMPLHSPAKLLPFTYHPHKLESPQQAGRLSGDAPSHTSTVPDC